MKYIFILIFSFFVSSAFSQFGDFFSKEKNVTYIGPYKSKNQLKKLMDDNTTLLVIIQGYVYKPSKSCLCKRNGGGDKAGRAGGADDAGRAGGTDDAGRDGGTDDAGRAGGADDAGRAGGGDDAGRSFGFDSAKRDDNGDKANRDSGNDSAGRSGGGDDAGRKNGGDDAGRSGGGDDAGRSNGGDDAGRAGGGDSVQIKCKKIKKECRFKLLNVNPNATIKVFDGISIKPVKNLIVEY